MTTIKQQHHKFQPSDGSHSLCRCAAFGQGTEQKACFTLQMKRGATAQSTCFVEVWDASASPQYSR